MNRLLLFDIDGTLVMGGPAKKAFEQAVWLYNHRRPHQMLNYQFPAEVHAQAA